MRLVAALLVVIAGAAPARAERRAPPPAHPLVALAPPAPGTDDPRRAVPIGPHGEVYAPDAKGAWVRTLPATTADVLSAAGRAGPAVVAVGEGVVYRLADNGWSAVRLTQRGGAVMAPGPRAVAAVGKQLFALDRLVGGEPAKLAQAASPVLAIGAGKAIVMATERGLVRVDGAKLTPVAHAPRRVNRLVSDQWALVDRGAVDLRTGTTTPWPAGVTVQVAAVGPGDGLVAVGASRAGLELVVITGKPAAVTREPIAITPGGTAVGVAMDRAGHAVVALRDGRLAVREPPPRGGAHGGRLPKGHTPAPTPPPTWTTVDVTEELPAARPGVPPAASP